MPIKDVLANSLPCLRTGNIEMSKIGNHNKHVVITIQGVDRDHHYVTEEELSIPVQDLCGKLLRSYFPAEEIGPAIVQLFGLASFNFEKKTCTWFNPRISLSKIKKTDMLENVHLRIRFFPLKEQLGGQSHHILRNMTPLLNQPSFLTKYMYFQWKNDFVSDRLKQFFRVEIPSVKARGVAILDLLITARVKGVDPPESVFKHIKNLYYQSSGKQAKFASFWDKYHVLPKREQDSFNCLECLKLKQNMRSTLRQYSEQNSAERVSVEELMLQYIREIMIDEMEYFVATRTDTGTRVEVTIKIPNGRGVYIKEISAETPNMRSDLFCKIEDLQSASVEETSYEVLTHRASGRPVGLCFDSLEAAESFVSGIDGYYRMICDYYFSLNDKVKPPSVKHLSSIKSHGPIEDQFAVKKLKTSYSEQGYYILKQDIYDPDKYGIVFTKDGQIMIKTLKMDSGKYFLVENPTYQFDDINKLLASLMGAGNILPKHAVRVKPTKECCEVLKNLFVSNSDMMLCEEEESGVPAKKRQPLVFLPSDIRIFQDEKLGNGYFSEVYKGNLKSIQKLVAVKQVRSHISTRKYQELRCFEAIQEGALKQLMFDDVRFFVEIYGVTLSSPSKIIEEYAQYGSLSKFFNLQKPFTLQHFVFIAIQLAEALYFMDEKHMCHGGICCKNIMVFRYDTGDIKIKLGDTGMLNIYNQLPISHVLNVQRLPWIAPELFDDLTKITIASDVYAYSTTLWECANFGHSPLSMKPLSGFPKDYNQIKDFYLKGNKIELPDEIQVKDDDEEKKKRHNRIRKAIGDVMLDCWKLTDRLETKDLLKMLRSELDGLYTDFGHVKTDDPRVYTEIKESEMDVSFVSSNNCSEPSQNNFNEIPNIIDILESRDRGGNQNHLAAEELRVKLPQLTDNGHQKPNKRTLLQDTEEHKLKLVLKFMIDSRRIKLINGNDGKLGAGYYGEVKKGFLDNSADSKRRKIAVKILKSNHYRHVKESPEFFHEAEVMSKLTHPNIVQFIGISDNMLVMEFVENGCMRDYLKSKFRKKKPESTQKLLKMCTDIAAGMAYLAQERILHCDLAARNVLLNSQLGAKISDFGLSKILDPEKDYYKNTSEKNLPAWWCSPEALYYKRFSEKSDVWSYGIVMWEAFTHSESPKLVKETKDVRKHLTLLDQGKRLPKPQLCPDNVYTLMRECWESEPSARPDFCIIEDRCRQLGLQYQEDTDVPENASGTQNPSNEQTTTVPPTSEQVTKSPSLEQQPVSPSLEQQQKTPSLPPPSKNKGLENDEPNKIAKPISEMLLQNGIPENPLLKKSIGTPLPGKPKAEILFLLKEHEVEFDDMAHPLGAGNFGVVYKGKLNKNNKTTTIAVKTLREQIENRKDEIEQEVGILIECHHPNVVEFYGFCRTKFLIVMELVDNGSLCKYLQKCSHENRELPNSELIKFCQGIAEGMTYLSSRNIIHCDLATRNVLLSKDMTTKISDFGLAKLLQEKDYYRRSGSKEMNVRWCAPEFFCERKLSSASDVWSFGIVIWEIFSGGKKPDWFGKIEDKNIPKYIIDYGCTLGKPEKCHDNLYAKMNQCWKKNPKERPTFPDLDQYLKTL